MAKDNMMKYNVDPIKGLTKDTIIKGSLNFDKEAKMELIKFEEACQMAYIRFYINRDNNNAELEFHKEIKKYRKIFNHNIQEITKKKKFSVITNINNKIKEYQIN